MKGDLLDSAGETGTVQGVNRADPYSVLSLPQPASPDEVRKAWRAAARRWHPDSGTEPDTDLFIQAKEAYEQLRITAPGPAPAARRRRAARPDTSGLPDHDPFRFQVGPSAPGRNLDVELPLSVSEAAAGGHARLSVSYVLTCPSCNGAPLVPPCPICNGTGQVPHMAAVKVFWEARTVDGARWRVPRAGGPGHGGGPPGDLIVHARIYP